MLIGSFQLDEVVPRQADQPALLAAWEVADALPRAAAVSADPEDRERVALAARHPRQVDAATVSALAEVLAATRRLEDQIGSTAVLPGIRSNRALARAEFGAALALGMEIDAPHRTSLVRQPQYVISISGRQDMVFEVRIMPRPETTLRKS